ncbi:MAG: M23 family metallopeptidase [Alphaproteobacteria bacterium]|nr:M23 family metallopeptidase [Alphaproteobacteria bacterium]MCL2504973.1 M23 family metallopeptidase [Alphaproteobacteria bacterium]
MLLRSVIAVLFFGVFLQGCAPDSNQYPYGTGRGVERGELITVRKNDNVYTIAKRNNVSMRELILVNDLQPPFDLQAGQKIYLPISDEDFAGKIAAPNAAPVGHVEKVPVASIGGARGKGKKEIVIGDDAIDDAILANQVDIYERRASVTAKTAEVKKEIEEVKKDDSMMWPVQGTVVSEFGSVNAGVRNDGMNIRAERGTNVAAVLDGVVAYVGFGLSDFGNLVLIKHRDNVITAYAHLDKILVKKNDEVRKGTAIGLVGTSGDVKEPLLHFEVRKNNASVDPRKFLESR